MKKMFISLSAILFFVSCSSAPEVKEPVSEQQQLEISKVSNIEKLRPKLGSSSLKEQETVWIAYVTYVNGKVETRRSDDTGTSVAISFATEKGHLLKVTDVLETSARSRAELVLRNGSKISIGPGSVLRLNAYDDNETLFYMNASLITGRARFDIRGDKSKTKVLIYTPNLLLRTNGAELALRYDSSFKTSYLACLEGELSANAITTNNTIKNYERVLGPEDHMTVETSYDGTRELYMASKVRKLTASSRKETLGGL